uniref:Uncharacterized protein n=1 Tax=Callorhinchus milii TaxID=7868 RepID=A0A4W3GGG2_CALMI
KLSLIFGSFSSVSNFGCGEKQMHYQCVIIEKGEENCRDLIEAHKDCMRALGFKI